MSGKRLPKAWKPQVEIPIPAELPADPKEAAQAVALKYVSDERPGIRRKKSGAGFTYVDPQGRTVRDEPTLVRIRTLAIPPAWTEVWICPESSGHLQATGTDARGRKQYRYHPRFRQARQQAKFNMMVEFGKALPRIRRRVEQDLRLPGLPREKVLAAVVKLLETTLIRVGNDEYAKENHSYGLTTMKDQHAQVRGAMVKFEFKGKSGIQHEIDLEDPRLAKIVKECQDLPGQELFQYVDEKGEVCDVNSTDVNDYIREISGQDFTAKDFRTWAGTVLAAMALSELQKFDSRAQAKRNIVQAVEAVATKLGNTKAVCRKCYIHPNIFDSYLDGGLAQVLQEKVETKLARSAGRLKPAEAMVLALLRGRLARANPGGGRLKTKEPRSAVGRAKRGSPSPLDLGSP